MTELVDVEGFERSGERAPSHPSGMRAEHITPSGEELLESPSIDPSDLTQRDADVRLHESSRSASTATPVERRPGTLEGSVTALRDAFEGQLLTPHGKEGSSSSRRTRLGPPPHTP